MLGKLGVTLMALVLTALAAYTYKEPYTLLDHDTMMSTECFVDSLRYAMASTESDRNG